MTTTKTLGGVIAAIATAIDDKGEPDSARSTVLARFLLANGCDGLNVLGRPAKPPRSRWISANAS